MTEGRVALITAGAAGIGLAIANKLSSQGITVITADKDTNALKSMTLENPDLNPILTDVSQAVEVERMFQEIRSKYKGLDILINNVGISGPTLAVEDIDIESWNETLKVNLDSAFYVTRLATPMLKERQGLIINIASTAGLFGCPQRSAYVASKWALVGLTKSWAMEMGEAKVRVNAICPGSVAGPRIDRVIDSHASERNRSSQEIRDIYLKQSSLGCFAQATDIANMAWFLCSEDAKHISGQALAIDGNTETLSNWLK